ncbi:MAG: succinate dehydrogenase cytochrome b558 subunit [Gemmatimonadota bacterium]|nr:succinate dehydrogenase cytochrome b558 subunit [Gemmatimonadota bacterium]
MSATTDSHPATGRIDRRTFWLRRIHSLTGIVPLGLYVVFHVWVNSFAASGPEAYNAIAEFLESLPYLLAIEIPFIWAPILYHGFYGIYLHAAGRENPFQYSYPNNAMYSLQRWSGIVTLVFIGWHFWQTRLANYLFGTPIDFQMMADIFAQPEWVVFYVIGLTAVAFHLGNGLRTFLLTWGIVVGDRARTMAARVAAVVGGVFLIVSLAAIWAFLR